LNGFKVALLEECRHRYTKRWGEDWGSNPIEAKLLRVSETNAITEQDARRVYGPLAKALDKARAFEQRRRGKEFEGDRFNEGHSGGAYAMMLSEFLSECAHAALPVPGSLMLEPRSDLNESEKQHAKKTFEHFNAVDGRSLVVDRWVMIHPQAKDLDCAVASLLLGGSSISTALAFRRKRDHRCTLAAVIDNETKYMRRLRSKTKR
jgi:hypothetical protein